MSNQFDELSRAKYCAFLYLGRKMYTRHEMLQKLLKKEYSPEVCEQTVDFLVESGYINDRDYAERYTKDAINFKKQGVMKIKQDLAQKGIDREIINSVIDELDIDNSENLAKLIEQKTQKLDITDKKQRNRLIGFLLRRGYKYDEIFTAIREYCDDEENYN